MAEVRCNQFAPRPSVVPEGLSAWCVRPAGHVGQHEGFYSISNGPDKAVTDTSVSWGTAEGLERIAVALERLADYAQPFPLHGAKAVVFPVEGVPQVTSSPTRTFDDNHCPCVSPQKRVCDREYGHPGMHRHKKEEIW